jgi:hypothetical protein
LDVLLDGRIEEHRFLSYIAHLLSVLTKLEVLNVNSVDQHLSTVGVVEALKELYDCGFARAGGSHNGGSLPQLELHGEVLEDLLVGPTGVEEVDVAELDVAPQVGA